MRNALHDAAPRLTAAWRPRFCGGVAAPPSARLPRLTAAMASRLSGALRLAGLDDYIAPSQVGRGGGGEGREGGGREVESSSRRQGSGGTGGRGPHGCQPPPWVLGAGRAGPPGLGPEVLPWAPRHPKGITETPSRVTEPPQRSPSHPKGLSNHPHGVTELPQRSSSHPKGHQTTSKGRPVTPPAGLGSWGQ